jgi:uncharacterized iron-regulated protein
MIWAGSVSADGSGLIYENLDDVLLPQADIFLLGEVHDNAGHHAYQAALTAQISPEAIVFEMVEMGVIDGANLRGIEDDARAEALSWNTGGWGDFSAYAQIIAAAPDAGIYAAGVPVETVREAMQVGADATFSGAAPRFGLDAPLSEDQQTARLILQDDAHCNAMPADMLPMMIEAQRLRDAELAQAALDAFDETGGPVVIITGNGHARKDWAVPALLAIARPDARVFAVGQTEDRAVMDGTFDLLLSSPAAEREDPCGAFR